MSNLPRQSLDKPPLWDYDKAYHHALKLISSQACSIKKIDDKLSKKTSSENRIEIIKVIKQQHLIDDIKLCKDTSLMWIQKKPISKTQLHQKLSSYGFEKNDIIYSLKELETTFNNKELQYIGGIPIALLNTFLYKNKKNTCSCLWNALALASCILIRKNNNSITYEGLHRKLQLRGYTINAQLSNLIHNTLQDFTD